jgi:outer membrane protein OmpA-like peptidoglycan-associated protein/outer membrane protein assembly factor BamB
MRALSVRFALFLIVITAAAMQPSLADDWPIFKGNIYFTGNNDEIIVKNSNLKWLFQADERVSNPVASDGRIYFTDLKGQVYCLDEEYGKVVWKVDLQKISSQFKAFSRAAGKVKYPLVKGNLLLISDPIAIYAFNKTTGQIIWARTGMREEDTRPQGLTGRTALPMVDGIYADPVILENEIYYGTRNMFLSREIGNGHLKWDNRTVKTYGGFPTFYDKFIFTQSMDFSTNRYTVYCLDSSTGREIWSRVIEKPMQIFPPVVYRNRVYLPSSKSVYCIDLKTGEPVWKRDYKDYITSIPGFTDRAILFSVGNSDILVIDPDSGEVLRDVAVAPKSSPYFVTVRDQLYVAYNITDTVGTKTLSYGIAKALNFTDNTQIWNYKTPFPGAVSQPIASKGILFLPAGNYLYALGTEYYPRIVDGGDGYAVVPGGKIPDTPKEIKPPVTAPREPLPEKMETRKMIVSIGDKDNAKVGAQVEIKQRKKGDVVYSGRATVNGKGEIEVPVGDEVELLVTAKGYVPKKEIIGGDEKEKTITLEKIETGKGFVVDNIYFEIDKAYLRKESLDIIDKLVQIMKANPAMKIEVRGHTDSTGEKAYNQKLSERRADAVAEYMIKNGISPERIRSAGLGETRPIASNETPEGRKKNRRTEFYFIE